MPDIPSTLLGDLTPETFLQAYWQKQPLLIRGALPGFTSPIAPEELAGLACEEDVEARLILEQGGAYPWQLRYGPFRERDFRRLPDSHWTLLVQEVDRLVPDVARLLDLFRFIPNWRIDDVMVSYAPPEGGVGAHIDNYDVFLLQGLGHRRWQISHTPVEEETLVPDLDVRILQDFEPDAEWVLGPGDLLYLPPRIPHYGVAVDDCMTFSIGFRAPSYEEVVSGYLTHMMGRLDPAARYSDPDLQVQDHPGRISQAAREQVRRIIRDLVDDAEIDRWFGAFMTEPRRGHYALPPDEPYTPDELAAHLRAGAVLRHSPAARFAFFEHGNGEVSLFVSGEEYLLDPPFAFVAPLLCDPAPRDAAALGAHLDDRDFRILLTDLVNEGYLEVTEA